MAQNYIKSIASTLKKRQGRQIISLLNKQKESGQIRSIQEFTRKLELMVKDLSQVELQPTTKMFAAENEDLIDSDSYNYMLQRVEDDLSAAFEEALALDEVQKSHEAIIRDVVLKKIEFNIAELEEKLKIYNHLLQSNDGFDQAIFSTFKESTDDRTTKATQKTNELFLDPKTLKPMPDAELDPIGERLILKNEIRKEHTIREIEQLFDDDAPQSEILTGSSDVDINNIIDNEKGTYWVQSTLFTDKPVSGLRVKFALYLDGVREITFVEVDPATKQGLVIESIDYLDGNEEVKNVSNPEQLITNSASVIIPPISTSKVIITFRDENYEQVEFEYDDSTEDKLLDTAINEPPELYDPNIQNLNADLDKIVNSKTIKEIIGISTPEKKTFFGYQFTTGIDNIRIGSFSQADKSIYISPPMKNVDVGLIGLKTSETRPVSDGISGSISSISDTYGLTDSQFAHSSIEYWISMKNFDKRDNVISAYRFPILPIDKTRIYHERLVPTQKSSSLSLFNDTGQLAFFTQRVAGNVKVYRNGVQLSSADDDSDITDGWLEVVETNDSIPNTGSRMRYRVRIQNPAPTDIYTVSYDPLTSSTISRPKTFSSYSSSGISIVDLTGNITARSLKDQTILLEKLNKRIVKSEIRLIIILRNNSSNKSITPTVEEYILLGNKIDRNKLEVN